jgi:site-specific recombinase XerD
VKTQREIPRTRSQDDRSLPLPARGVDSAPVALTTSAAGYAADEKAAATRLAYRSDWRHFQTWCEGAKANPLPASPATTAAYLADLADSGLKASTNSRRLAAIAYAHRLKGLDAPTSSEAVHAVLRGIRRRLGVAPVRKAPATAKAIGAMLEHVPDTLIGKRDRALLLIGFAAALRRSELAALRVPDIEMHEEGILLHIRRSKTDQEGEGAQIPIPRGGRLMVVEALEAWLAAAKIADGPAFVSIGKGDRVSQKRISDNAIGEIVKRYAAAAGFDPKEFAGHSLRAGFVTSALEHGADVLKVMDVTRHRRVETLKGYDRRAKAFRNHAGDAFL